LSSNDYSSFYIALRMLLHYLGKSKQKNRL